MNVNARTWMIAFVFAVALTTLAPSLALAEKAVCRVCQVMEGESEAENVRARRTHEGHKFGFCSKKCAEIFDADPAAFLPPVFPRPAPTFDLTGLSGDPVTTDSLLGQVVLLDFWATWCLPCRKAMPELQTLQDKLADKGFTVVGISIDEEPKKVAQFVEKYEIDYPIAIDSEEDPSWHAYYVKAVPASFLIDKEGQIVAQWLGVVANVEELEAKLEELLAQAPESDSGSETD